MNQLNQIRLFFIQFDFYLLSMSIALNLNTSLKTKVSFFFGKYSIQYGKMI